MASSLSQVRSLILYLDNGKEEKKVYRPCFFNSNVELEIEEILHGSLALASHRSAQFSSFFCSILEFHRKRGIELRRILNPAHLALLQPPKCIFFTFSNDFGTH